MEESCNLSENILQNEGRKEERKEGMKRCGQKLLEYSRVLKVFFFLY